MTTHGSSEQTTARAFGEFLVAEGVLRAESLRQVLDILSTTGGRLDTVLLDLRLVQESQLLDAVGRFHATKTVTRAELSVIPPEVVRMISPRMAERLEIVPFRLDGRTLCVATLSPDDMLVEDELGLLTDCRISSFATLEVHLYEALSRVYHVEPSIQIASVLKRSAGAADTAPVDPSSNVVEWRSTPIEPSPDDTTVTRSPAPGASAPAGFPPATQREKLELEISDEELAQFPSLREGVREADRNARRSDTRPVEPPLPADPDQRLEKVTVALQDAEMREDIADAVLEFCRPILRRRLLLFVRNESVIGWRGEGDGLEASLVRRIEIPLSEPSVFVGLSQGTEFWLGPLPRMPRNQDLVRGLGGVPPAECIILPLIVRGKTVCFLYGDNVDQPASGLPISQLRRLVAKASLAFQVYILKSKIRNL